MTITNPTLARVVGFLFNVERHALKYPFEVVRYENGLADLDFYQYTLARFQEHSDIVVRELEEAIKECKEENLQKDK